ncbi:MAG TPA: hypothetical protein VF639_13940 [Hymenobacter sp.]|jgi:hypothetical protein
MIIAEVLLPDNFRSYTVGAFVFQELNTPKINAEDYIQFVVGSPTSASGTGAAQKPPASSRLPQPGW